MRNELGDGALNVAMTSVYTIVDSILNQKTPEMQEKSIRLESVINISTMVEIEEINLSRLLDYLLENTIEECMKVQNERRIELSIMILKKHLYVMLVSTSGVKRENISRRFGPIIGGKSVINILRIDSIIKKYCGFINHHIEGKTHVTEILIPVSGVK